MKLGQSLQDYLEAILVVGQKQVSVRSIDVALHLQVSKPSVSRAMKVLMKKGHIAMDETKQILLTESGKRVAVKIYEKHCVLENLLLALGVDKQTAAKEACAMEHIISDITFEKVKKYLAKRESAIQHNKEIRNNTGVDKEWYTV